MATLSGKRVAILVAEGFEQIEMVGPRKALLKADAAIASPAKDYDALLLPGGVANPDRLRRGVWR